MATDCLRPSSKPSTPPSSMERRAAPLRRRLGRAGFNPGPLLGAGFDGAVFRVEPGLVVKATSCAAEALFFRWLQETGGHPGFPGPVDVADIGTWQGSRLYAVVREDVPDLVVEGLPWFYMGADALPARGLLPASRCGPSREDWDQCAQRALDAARPAHKGLLADLVDVLTWAMLRGCLFPPIHEGNLGLRGTQIVVRDLSRAYPPLPCNLKIRASRG